MIHTVISMYVICVTKSVIGFSPNCEAWTVFIFNGKRLFILLQFAVIIKPCVLHTNKNTKTRHIYVKCWSWRHYIRLCPCCVLFIFHDVWVCDCASPLLPLPAAVVLSHFYMSHFFPLTKHWLKHNKNATKRLYSTHQMCNNTDIGQFYPVNDSSCSWIIRILKAGWASVSKQNEAHSPPHHNTLIISVSRPY